MNWGWCMCHQIRRYFLQAGTFFFIKHTDEINFTDLHPVADSFIWFSPNQSGEIHHQTPSSHDEHQRLQVFILFWQPRSTNLWNTICSGKYVPPFHTSMNCACIPHQECYHLRCSTSATQTWTSVLFLFIYFFVKYERMINYFQKETHSRL